MKQAKIFSVVVMLAVLCYGAVGFYFLPLATFQGELARMALLPESLFGWTKPQPAIDKRWMQQSSMETADVLVIGDSFSDPRIWQTALTQQGLQVRTESWNTMRGICEDFTPWIRARGFQGRFVVFESIERNLAEDLRKSVACRQMQYHPNPKTDAAPRPPTVSYNVHRGNYSGKLSTGIQTYLNVMAYERMRLREDLKLWHLPNEVTMARIENGCELFSHSRCTESLFYSIDKAEDIAAGALKDIDTLNTRLTDITPIWVFVPNKSTAYLYPEKQFWKEAEHRFNAPNLLHMTQQAIDRKVIDLYPANGTHFSTTGYLLMGEEILKTLQQIEPNPAIR